MKAFNNSAFLCDLQVSGKLFEGDPCTPSCDPASLEPEVQEAQGEELVSIPVFITAAGLNENIIVGNRNGT